MSDIVARAALGVALGAFGVTGALSLRAQVEPLYAVVRGIVAFVGVLWAARWSANALDALAAPGSAAGTREQPGATDGRVGGRGSLPRSVEGQVGEAGETAREGKGSPVGTRSGTER